MNFLVAVVVLALTVYQFKRGAVFTRGWGIGATRADNPIEFWVLISIQVLVALGMLIIGVIGSIHGHN